MPDGVAIRGATAAPTVSAVVCAYTEERWEQILAAVGSLLRQVPPPDQVLLVVDHNDVLLRRARGALGDGVEVVANEGPRGLSGARNTGVARATGDVVAFLDDDATAEPGFLARLLAAYADPSVAGAGASATAVWPGERPRWFPDEFEWVVGCSYRGLPQTVAPVRNLIGAGMSYRRAALAAAGPFDTAVGRVGRLPLGCEETELSIRMRAALPGAELLHVPAATVRHAVSADRTRPAYFVRRCFAEGISKALVAERVGRERGLQSERAHALRTLPKGVARGLREALGGDVDGLLRAAAIVLGLVVTAAGLAFGEGRIAALRLAGRRRRVRT